MVTVARVQVFTELDSRGLPGDARKAGEAAGRATATGYDRTWSKGFEDTLTEAGRKALADWRKNGTLGGKAYGDGLTREVGIRLNAFVNEAQKNFNSLRLDPNFLGDFSRKFDDAGVAAGELQKQLVTLRDEGVISRREFTNAAMQLDVFAGSQRSSAAESKRQRDAIAQLNDDLRTQKIALGELDDQLAAKVATMRKYSTAVAENRQANRDFVRSLDALEVSAGRAGTAVRELDINYRDLPHGMRQAVFWTGFFVSAAEQIAVLGSAAGAGLLAVGSGAVSLVAGGGALAAIFVTLNKELDELPPSLRPVAAEFRNFGSVFGEMRAAIAQGGIPEMAGSFDSLRSTLSRITPEMAALGKTTGILFSDMAKNIRPGTEGFEQLQRMAQQTGPLLDSLGRSGGTLGLSLVRSFNRANPLAQQMAGYIETLTDRFDDFSRSDDFAQWVTNSSNVWREFGGLLDAAGRSLNDLVTTESIDRSIQFQRNLTEFMPSLTRLLQVAGELDVFGVAAQLLNDLGMALAPLAEPAEDLASALNRLVTIGIEQFAAQLSLVAAVSAPVAQALADLVNAIPEDVLRGAANGLLVLAGAALGLRTIRGLDAAITGFGLLTTRLEKIPGVGSRAAGALTKLGAAAGPIAAVGAAAAIGLPILMDWVRGMEQVEDRTRRLISGSNDLPQMWDAWRNGVPATEIKDWGAALDEVANSAGNGFRNLTMVWSENGQAGLEIIGMLGELDKELGPLAQNSLPQAAAEFSGWAASIGASDAQMMAMINEMPLFKEALEQQARSSNMAATDANLLELALSGMSSEQRMAQQDAFNHAEALEAMRGVVVTGGEAIDGLADKIRNFGSATLTTRDAERQFQEAVDQATAALGINGTSLDTNEAQGRENQAALDAIAKSALDFAGATYEETRSVEKASGAIRTGRDRLLEQLAALGITGAEADAYADKLGLIPENVNSIIHLDDREATRRADGFITRYDGKTIRMNIVTTQRGSVGPTGAVAYASGGVADRATYGVYGEAGPEALVPLNRPLSQVDPRVRWLSGVAQGLIQPQAPSTPSKVITIQPGAIVVYAAEDSRATANDVLTRLVEDLR